MIRGRRKQLLNTYLFNVSPPVSAMLGYQWSPYPSVMTPGLFLSYLQGRLTGMLAKSFVQAS
jgi:hypothetical protein